MVAHARGDARTTRSSRSRDLPPIASKGAVTVQYQSRSGALQQSNCWSAPGREKFCIPNHYAMGTHATRRGRVSLSGQIYHVVVTTADRQRHFVNFETACLCAKTFQESASAESAQLLAWVLMPDHAHWLIRLGGAGDLPACVNRFKGRARRSMRTILSGETTVWQRGYYDHALRSDESVEAVARYIVANPIRAGLVTSVRDYSFWDAVWL